MPSRHQLILALSIPLTLTVVVILGFVLAQPAPEIQISDAPAQFNAARALNDAAQFDAQFPRRVVGSTESLDAGQWIKARFTELGLAPQVLPFTITVASQERFGEQIWAAAPGASDEIVLVTAHYDTPEQGGRSNAAGVAALLELARVFAAERPPRTLLFLASDARYYGLSWGAHNFVDQFPLARKIVAVLDLDATVGLERSGLQIDSAGYRLGYAPLWLRQIGRRAVEAAGGQAQEPAGLAEFFARALPFAMTDYGFFLRSGIPAIGLSGAPNELAVLGRAAEISARSAAVLDPVLPPNAGEWRLSDNVYLPALGTVFLPLLVFAPLFIAIGLAVRAERPRWPALRPELSALFGVIVALVDGYAVGFSLLVLGLLPRYEWFPATPGERFLVWPTDWAALLIFGTMAVFGWTIFGRPGSWGFLADLLEIPYRRVTLLIGLALLVVGMWLLNGLATALLLAPAAYLWPWITPRPFSAGKFLNGMLALGGALPLIGVWVAIGVTPDQWSGWWLLLIGPVYGWLPLPVLAGFVVGLALLLRFLRLGLR